MGSSQCGRLEAGGRGQGHRGVPGDLGAEAQQRSVLFPTSWHLLMGEPCPMKAHPQKSHRVKWEEILELQNYSPIKHLSSQRAEQGCEATGRRQRTGGTWEWWLSGVRGITRGGGCALFIHSWPSDDQKEKASWGNLFHILLPPAICILTYTTGQATVSSWDLIPG